MPEASYRILIICSHPVQYMSPLLRRMAQHPRIDLQVAYCSLRGAHSAYDPGFATAVQWDVPLLDGYNWVEIPNIGTGAESFLGLCNPELWRLIRRGSFDAVLCHTGYLKASFWIAFLAARLNGSVFLFGTDANSLASRNSVSWKISLKKVLWPRLFSLADQIIVPSSKTRDLMRSLGFTEDRITLTPYCVDNDWWAAQSAQVDRAAARSAWRVEPDSTVVLFCAKLQPWKRPGDLLEAFAATGILRAVLVFAGDGPLRQTLYQRALDLGIADRVRFLGFVNQSALPAVYKAADLMVLPSEYEPFAVVVNEALCCGCPVAASDRVGAATDLIAPVNPDFVFPCGDVPALTEILQSAVSDPTELARRGQDSLRRMQSWSTQENISGVLEAVERALSRARAKRGVP
jgi:glycosyltransferase involved in cell wall biosynthesis